ncbi:MAG: 8-amino-7-oxononanoate synthase [Isosphaeraceae bacterium]
MSNPLDWLDAVAAERRAAGLSRALIPCRPARPGWVERNGRVLRHFGSNDYLGLAGDPRLKAAATSAMATHGWGTRASALVSGWTELHQELVEALAQFEQTEAAALFPTGFAANLGTVAALAGPEDAIYCDRLNHACLIAGARLSGARLRVFPHADAERLAAILERDRGRFRRSLIATDGVFSMDGDLAPLARLVELADAFGAMLLVDEAHGTGVFGATGRGAGEASGVADAIPIRVGTLSKALGGLGGFVAGSRRLVDHLINHAGSLIYSTALPPAAAAAALAALEIVRQEPQRREHVLALGAHLRAGMSALGLRTLSESGPIVPLLVGSADEAVALASQLEARGHFVPAIRPPTVPANTARLRISLTASHTIDDVDQLLADLARVAEGS